MECILGPTGDHQGIHRDCKCLVAVKKLGDNCEPRMLQWLVAGLNCPGGRSDGGPIHKQTSLVISHGFES